MKVQKSAVTLWVLVLLGMVIVSGCGPVTVETPVPTPDIAAIAKAAAATAVASQPTPNATATYAAIATEIAIAYLEPTVTPTPVPPTATPEPTDTLTVGLTDTPSPTDTPIATPTATPTQAEPAATPDLADISTATPTSRVVNIPGIICKVAREDTEGFTVWLPQRLIDAHFSPLGITPPFSATVRPVHPQTEALVGEWVPLTVDSFGNSKGMTGWEDCELTMKKDARDALCGGDPGDPDCDLNEIADKDIKEKIRDRTLDRTLRFVIEGE